VIFTPPPPAG